MRAASTPSLASRPAETVPGAAPVIPSKRLELLLEPAANLEHAVERPVSGVDLRVAEEGERREM